MKRVLLWGLVVPALLHRLVPRALRESPRLVAARQPRVALLLVAGAAAIGGLAVASSGVVPMKASTGHWEITARFLHFSMRQSVKTHAIGISVPALEDEALVLRGAAHYDLACRACHGAAGGEIPVLPAAMIPRPRALAIHARDWRPRELFYIVKHGMKFTAMPAWPAQQRDDEVWAMVAFLRRLPSLGSGEYDRLVRGTASEPLDLVDVLQPPDVVATNCARCHRVDGTGRGPGAFPRLAGQRAEYLDRALRAYASGRRHSGIMGPIAAALTDEARRLAVDHYASLAPPVSGAVLPPGGAVPAASEGLAIATEGQPAELIPACVECHGPAAQPKNPAFPRLAGQFDSYLAGQLRLLRDGRRGGSEYVHLMQAVAARLSDRQIEAVARYYSSLAD
jgi:cytochrome c553